MEKNILFFRPRIVDKTTLHPEPPNDPEFDHKVAHIQPNEVRDTYIFFMNGFNFHKITHLI